MIATKEQELKAVEKIRKIVESLGTDSYVGTAMEGVLEIAEENIQNDFACSMKNRAELAERELKDTSSRLSGKINELQNTIEHLQIEKKGLQAVNTRLLNELEEEEEWKAYGRCPVERYKELSRSALSRFLNDEYCKKLLYRLYGFAEEKIAIIRDVPICQINRHGKIRITGTEIREPIYVSTDWNYIRFSVCGLEYELYNGNLSVV